MSERTRQIMRLAAGLVLAGLAGCESTTQYTSPGALPMRRLDGDPKLSASTYIAHGNLLERQGAYDRAAEQYRKAVELTPNSVIAHNRLGVTLNKLGQNAEASAEFRAAIRLRPDQASLYNNLGFSLYLEQRYQEAAATLDQALTIDPTFRRARMNRGLVLAKMGDYEAALKEFTLAGDESEAYYNLAVILADDGRYAEAAKALELVRTANPNFQEAADLLRQISQLAAAQEAAAQAAAEAAAAQVAPDIAAAEATPDIAAAPAQPDAAVPTIATPAITPGTFAAALPETYGSVTIGPVVNADGSYADGDDEGSDTITAGSDETDNQTTAAPNDPAGGSATGPDEGTGGNAAGPTKETGGNAAGPANVAAPVIAQAELEQAVRVSATTDSAGDWQTTAAVETARNGIHPQQRAAGAAVAGAMLAEIDRFICLVTGVRGADLTPHRELTVAVDNWVSSWN